MSKKLTPKTTTRVPSLCLHKATGQARATSRSRSFYFGRYGSREAARRYAEWVVLITQDPTAVPITTRARAGHAVTIAELINAYEEHHETTFAGRTDDAIRTARSRSPDRRRSPPSASRRGPRHRFRCPHARRDP